MTTSRFEETDFARSSNVALDKLASKHFGVDVVPVKVEFGALSHPGLRRPNNEDHYCVVRRTRERHVLLTNLPAEAYPPHTNEAYALAVADGLGGAAFGELASMVALRTGWELTGKAFHWTFQLSPSEITELEESMNVYMHLIHQRIKKEAKAHADYQGMGTTLTGALTVGFDAFVVHVGDSRAYLYRGGTLHRLTRDQTLAEAMVTAGLITSADEAAERFQNTLLSCLGGKLKEIEVETTHCSMQDGDQLLLCTDGLTNLVSDPEIAKILGHASSCPTQAQQLIDAALAAGGTDNVTVVLGRYTVNS